MAIEGMLAKLEEGKDALFEIMSMLPPDLGEYLDSSEFQMTCHEQFDGLDEDRRERRDVARHGGLELAAQAEHVVDDHLAEPLEPALEGVEPRRRALQPVRGAHVVHEVAVEVAHQRLVVEVTGQQPGVGRGGR